MVALGRFLFRYRGAVSTLILLIVLAVSSPRHLQGSPALDRWMDVLKHRLQQTPYSGLW